MSVVLQDFLAIIPAVGAAVAAVSLVFAVRQYTVGERWRQQTFVTELANRVYGDKALKLATMFIDWTEKDILLPEEYRGYSSNGILKFDVRDFDEAFDIGNYERTPTGDWRPLPKISDWRFSFYIEIMDHMFLYLENVEAAIGRRLVSPDDLPYVRYIVRRIAHSGLLLAYIDRFGLTEVNNLVRRCA